MTGHETLSVIIRNRNESRDLSKVLKSLSLQDRTDIEIVVVDNESEDNSVEVAMRFGAKVVRIERTSFTYGRALNIGIKEATGDVCIILSAHSLPVGASFLSECLKPFSDKRIAATRCVYLGKEADLLRWMEPETLDASADIGAIISKGPFASGCAIRRSVWEKTPFDEEATAAEEKLWAIEVLQRGHLIYSPCAAFYYCLKTLSFTAQVRKNYREIVEIYYSTGRKIGFVNSGLVNGVIGLSKAVMYGAPRAPISVTGKEALRAYLRLSSPFRARKRLPVGLISELHDE